MDKATVIHRLKIALGELEKDHHEILVADVNERTIVNYLAFYLRDQFREHAVDVDYNRQGKGTEPKRLRSKGGPIVPDVIVHKRGGNSDNLLAVECKKSTNRDRSARRKDIEKLEGLKKAPKRYRFAAFVEIQAGPNRLPNGGHTIRWI